MFVTFYATQQLLKKAQHIILYHRFTTIKVCLYDTNVSISVTQISYTQPCLFIFTQTATKSDESL